MINQSELPPRLSLGGAGPRWGWGSVYENGPKDDELTYCRDASELTIVPWDNSFVDKGVMDTAANDRAGDEDATCSLYISFKPNPPRSGRARPPSRWCLRDYDDQAKACSPPRSSRSAIRRV